jgi:hypothetical protein
MQGPFDSTSSSLIFGVSRQSSDVSGVKFGLHLPKAMSIA